MNTDHATYDPAIGTITVTLETLYRDLAEWHLDEETDAEEALDSARSFLLRLFGLTATTRGDTAATFAERFLTRLPHGTRHEIHRIEVDLAEMWSDLHNSDGTFTEVS